MSSIARNNVRTAGKGDTAIVFAHGFGCDQSIWRFVAPAFENDYLTVLFDHVGAGAADPASYDPLRYQSLAPYAEDLCDICDALRLRGAVLVGHSVSAMIGVLAAVAAPQLFSRLILIGPSPCYINSDGYVGGFERADIEGLLNFMDDNFVAWSHSMAPAIMGQPARPELGRELASSFCRTDPRAARQFARVSFLSDHRADLARVRVPALILQCSDDAIAPPQVGQYLQRSLAGSTLVQLRARGHCPHLSAPEETVAAMRDYLRAAA